MEILRCEYCNNEFEANNNTDLYNSEEVEIKRIEASKEVAALRVEIKRIKASKEVDLKRIEADKEVEIKRMNLLSEGKITFEQYIQLRNLK